MRDKKNLSEDTLDEDTIVDDNTESGPEDPFEAAGRRWYEKGRAFKKQGDFANAIVCFQSMLKEKGNDPVALNELYKCCLLDRRLKEGVDAVNALMKIYVGENKKTEALTVFGELMQAQPEHCFDQDIQLTLSEWLVELRDFEGAVVALKNYVHRYPHDQLCPSLLLRGARLCNDRLKDSIKTKEMAEWITEKYPDSKAAEEAALLYFDQEM